MNSYKNVFFVQGTLLVILGLFMLLPIIAETVYQEKSSIFINSSAVTIFIGILLILSNLDKNPKLNLQGAFLLSSISWLAIAIFGSLPFLFSDLNFSISEAFFESMSGITTTGSTVIDDLDSAPKGILIWRAILQWLGGIGIIVMAITVLPLLNVGGMEMFRIESSDTTEKILPKTQEIALIIFLIYLTLTILCIVSYCLAGMNLFDGITHAMTTIATGGFSNYNDSIGFFQNSNIEIVSIVFIILGSIPFISYIKFINGKKKIFFQDVQIRGLIYLIIFSVLIMFIYLMLSNENTFLNNLRQSMFNVLSILSGTGYVTTDFSAWGTFPLVFFLFLMFIGGCAGSTTCGIKIFRVQILGLFILNQFKKLAYPRGIFPINYNKEKISDPFMMSVITFIFVYFFIFFIISILLSLTGLEFMSAISGAATAISNVGPGLGSNIGPNGNFKEISDTAKWILSFGMILGRLELFAILILFVPAFWKN